MKRQTRGIESKTMCGTCGTPMNDAKLRLYPAHDEIKKSDDGKIVSTHFRMSCQQELFNSYFCIGFRIREKPSEKKRTINQFGIHLLKLDKTI